jgi:hypothetical protein
MRRTNPPSLGLLAGAPVGCSSYRCRESETLHRRERAAIIVISLQARRLICWYSRGEWAKPLGSVLTSL